MFSWDLLEFLPMWALSSGNVSDNGWSTQLWRLFRRKTRHRRQDPMSRLDSDKLTCVDQYILSFYMRWPIYFKFLLYHLPIYSSCDIVMWSLMCVSDSACVSAFLSRTVPGTDLTCISESQVCTSTCANGYIQDNGGSSTTYNCSEINLPPVVNTCQSKTHSPTKC